MSEVLTLPDPPTTADISVIALASMGAQTGIVSDYNVGSNIRTLLESMGSVVETQGVFAQALAFQSIVYAAYQAFGITPALAVPAIGQVTFMTSTGTSLPPVTQNVLIPTGTLVQAGNVQFVTTADVLMSVGATTIVAPIQAVEPGAVGNVAAGTITTLSSGIGYPLFVTNPSPTQYGLDAETAEQTLQRFTSKVLSLGLASPIAIANACIGAGVTGTSEIVRYATVYEPWITQSVGSQTAGFTLCIDNGTGAASTSLITAVTNLINGSRALAMEGYRPAGVPYVVQAVQPVNSSVQVSASLLNPSLAASLTAAVATAVNTYYAALNFGDTATQTGLIAAVANALAGYATNISVVLLNASNVAVSTITTTAVQRCILANLTTTLA